MNKEKRTKLNEVLKRLDALDMLREEIINSITEVMEDEEDCRDNVPESFEEKIEKYDTIIDYLCEVISGLEDIDIHDLYDNVQNAINE